MSEGGDPERGTEDLGTRDGREALNPKGGHLKAVILPASITLLVVMLLAWALMTWADEDHGHGGTDGLGSPGAAAPEFSFPSVDPRSAAVSLRDFRGKVIVLNFWASWCGPCRQEAPGLRTVSDEYRDRGVRFIGIDERDNRDDALAFLSEFSIAYPNAFDPSGMIAESYGLLGLPATIVVDTSGVVVNRFIGYLGEDTLREALDSELDRSRPSVTAG